jgi:hypothetical protein
MSNEAFAKIEAGQKLLTFAPLLAILRAGTLERSFAGRRPGRPCIDEQVQAVIRRRATENRLYVKPKIMWRSGLSSPHVVEIGWGSRATAAGYST